MPPHAPMGGDHAYDIVRRLVGSSTQLVPSIMRPGSRPDYMKKSTLFQPLRRPDTIFARKAGFRHGPQRQVQTEALSKQQEQSETSTPRGDR